MLLIYVTNSSTTAPALHPCCEERSRARPSFLVLLHCVSDQELNITEWGALSSAPLQPNAAVSYVPVVIRVISSIQPPPDRSSTASGISTRSQAPPNACGC